jgi:hypothetical protein
MLKSGGTIIGNTRNMFLPVESFKMFEKYGIFTEFEG